MHDVIHGDSLTVLRTLPDESIQCCVTSPPYFGLRSYLPEGHEDKHLEQGLEESPDEYVSRMVEVFREVRRVLRHDGTCWINIGDSYAAQRSGTGMPAETLSGGVGGKGDEDSHRGRRQIISSKTERGQESSPSRSKPLAHRNCQSFGLKHKDLIGIPWRLAFALQADGWWLRQEIIWAKGCSGAYRGGSVMPESVQDRCTKSHETVFLLSKSDRYFFDSEAIAERPEGPIDGRGSTAERKAAGHPTRYGNTAGKASRGEGFTMPSISPREGGRNRRSVWVVNTRPYKGAHFATMPPSLAETCILAGTSEHGRCPDCGSPWKRVTERKKLFRDRPNDYVKRTGEQGTGNSCGNTVAGVAVKTLGWEPTCRCDNPRVVPCTVLDPFAGSGTTLAVAASLGLDGIGIELNADYIELAKKRISESVLLFA